MAPVSFLPTQVYEEAKLNRMQGKAGRVRLYHSFISSLQQIMLQQDPDHGCEMKGFPNRFLGKVNEKIFYVYNKNNLYLLIIAISLIFIYLMMAFTCWNRIDVF